MRLWPMLLGSSPHAPRAFPLTTNQIEAVVMADNPGTRAGGDGSLAREAEIAQQLLGRHRCSIGAKRGDRRNRDDGDHAEHDHYREEFDKTKPVAPPPTAGLETCSVDPHPVRLTNRSHRSRWCWPRIYRPSGHTPIRWPRPQAESAEAPGATCRLRREQCCPCCRGSREALAASPCPTSLVRRTSDTSGVAR